MATLINALDLTASGTHSSSWRAWRASPALPAALPHCAVDVHTRQLHSISSRLTLLKAMHIRQRSSSCCDGLGTAKLQQELGAVCWLWHDWTPVIEGGTP
jgi:hypothetical protein